MEHEGTGKIVRLMNDRGEVLEVELIPEGEHFLGIIYVDGIPYHIERLPAAVFRQKYCVDVDPDYIPKSDRNDNCVLMAPYSQ